MCALLVLAAACASGLVLGLVGAFSLALILPLMLGAAACGWWWRPRGAADEPRRPAWVAVLLFVAVAGFYAPGYDVVVHGSDATVYFDVGAHLARTGSLAIEDPLLDRMPPSLQRRVFPVLHGQPRLYRSISGLMFSDFHGPVWSTFSALPSVWLAFGWAVAGDVGARMVTPLLGAMAVTAIFLVLRALAGGVTALLAASLLAVALPQVFFARLPMGEVGGQALLWLALLALQRFQDTRAPIAAVAAGLGLGLASIARVELLIFIPLALLIGEIAGRAWRVRLPLVVLPPLLAGFAWAAFSAIFLPTHYTSALHWLLEPTRIAAAVSAAPSTLAIPILLAMMGVAFLWWQRGRRALWRIALVPLVAGWAWLFVGMDRSMSVGRALAWLPEYVGWGGAILALPGIALLLYRGHDRLVGRFAILLATVAALHLLVDLHAVATPVWAGRRLLPVVLPVVCWGVAACVVALGRRVRPLGAIAGALVLAFAVVPVSRIAGTDYWRGTSGQLAELAQRFPADAVVLTDMSFRESLLDVGLWLVHGRLSVAMPAGEPLDVMPGLILASRPRRVFLLRHAFLPKPKREGIRLDEVGTTALTLRIPGLEKTATLQVPIRIYEAFIAPRGS